MFSLFPTARIARHAALAGALAFAAAFAGAGSPAGATTLSEEHVTGLETAIFAGGCFWCVEKDFDHVPGVKDTVSGFSGGDIEDPGYKQVTYENTGHREVVKITFDPKEVSYEHLLDVFWHSVDPTDAGGQFCDRGFSYTTAIYATSPEQLAAANASKAALEASGVLKAPIATEIAQAKPFWPAEDYHQNYHETNTTKYGFYRWRCGRDARVEELWGNDAHKGIVKK